MIKWIASTTGGEGAHDASMRDIMCIHNTHIMLQGRLKI